MATWLSLGDQVQKLESRNLEVGELAQATHSLNRVGYYRLTGYLHPFQQKTVETKANGTTQVTLLSSYEPGTTLDQVMALVDYDRRLRLLMLDAVERVEISVRMRMGYTWAKNHRSPISTAPLSRTISYAGTSTVHGWPRRRRVIGAHMSCSSNTLMTPTKASCRFGR